MQVFSLDMVMQFFLPYQDAQMTWINRRSSIVWHYLTGWFLIDIISVLPFEVMAGAFNSQCV